VVFHEDEIGGRVPKIYCRRFGEDGIPVAAWIGLRVAIYIEAMRIVGRYWSVCVIGEVCGYSHIVDGGVTVSEIQIGLEVCSIPPCSNTDTLYILCVSYGEEIPTTVTTNAPVVGHLSNSKISLIATSTKT
jgi:hypothetical protein